MHFVTLLTVAAGILSSVEAIPRPLPHGHPIAARAGNLNQFKKSSGKVAATGNAGGSATATTTATVAAAASAASGAEFLSASAAAAQVVSNISVL